MTLTDFSILVNMTIAIALVISAVAVLYELRQGNKLTRAANSEALVGLSSPYYLGLIQDRKMAELYVLGSTQFPKLDEVDQHRYQSLLFWWLILHENIYYQWRRGLLDGHSYKPWAKELQRFASVQNLDEHWRTMRQLFQDDFANHVGRLVEHGPTNRAVDR